MNNAAIQRLVRDQTRKGFLRPHQELAALCLRVPDTFADAEITFLLSAGRARRLSAADDRRLGELAARVIRLTPPPPANGELAELLARRGA